MDFIRLHTIIIMAMVQVEIPETLPGLLDTRYLKEFKTALDFIMQPSWFLLIL